MDEIEARVKLELMIPWLHVNTESIKGVVMFTLFEMRELVNHDHLQERLWTALKEARDAQLSPRFESTPMG